MNYIPAPMPENEARRQEAVERLQIKGTDQHDVMVVYSEMAQELTGFSSVLASIFDDNPVIFIEHRWLHNTSGLVPSGDYRVPLGEAEFLREGRDLTSDTPAASPSL